MELVLEKAVIVSLHDQQARVAPVSENACSTCASGSACSSALLAPLFRNKSRTLTVDNTVNAKTGEEVTIGLNRMALVVASLLVYLLPVLMLLAGAIIGEAMSFAIGLEGNELISILTGIGSAGLTFLIVSRLVGSAYFALFFNPVIIDHDERSQETGGR